LFFIQNADYRTQGVALPPSADRAPWRRVIDTSLPAGEDFSEEGQEGALDNQIRYLAAPRSTVVLVGA
jgi:hypothetical protein